MGALESALTIAMEHKDYRKLSIIAERIEKNSVVRGYEINGLFLYTERE